MVPNLTGMMPTTETVLLCIREAWATTSDQLVTMFGFLPEESHTGHYMIQDALLKLERASLISIAAKDENFRKWSFAVSNNLLEIQVALGVGLRSLAVNPRQERMVVTPIFGRTASNERRYDVFVVMPFAKKLAAAAVYKDHITNVLGKMSLTFARADDFFSAREVIRDVWSGICNSDIIIADCTTKNANVFYELGLAHAIGKPVILITETSSDIPFDIGYIRYITYQYTPPGMKEFEARLAATIETIRQDPMFELRRRLHVGMTVDAPQG
jgi:hypothetical protein